MSLMKLPYATLDLEAELSIAQFVIPAGAGGTYAVSNNVATFTTNAAHGLTLNPAAGVPPNYFVTFGGSSSGITGTGVLIGNIFRILSIPSTTTFTFYCTITAATVTSTTVIPVFFPSFISGSLSQYANGPTQTVSSVTTTYSPPLLEAATVFARNAANCVVRVNTDQLAVILDAQSTAAQTGGNTPATAPTWRDQISASTNGMAWLSAPWGAIWANGTTATSTFSVIN
jgi:hypothetical protein